MRGDVPITVIMNGAEIPTKALNLMIKIPVTFGEVKCTITW